MTIREKDLLNFLQEFYNEHGYSPTIKEICFGINTKSVSHVQLMLQKLKNENYISFVDGTTRTITIKEKAYTV